MLAWKISPLMVPSETVRLQRVGNATRSTPKRAKPTSKTGSWYNSLHLLHGEPPSIRRYVVLQAPQRIPEQLKLHCWSDSFNFNCVGRL